MRTRKKKWTAAELAANGRIAREPALYKGRWRDFFGNKNPVALELGCGKGRFLSESSLLNPDINYIGLERNATILGSAARQGAERENLALILGEAQSVTDFFGEGEIDAIYINFCDPWPNKKKWAKRRLTHARFLESYKKILRTGGSVRLKTDNRLLFEFSIVSLSENGFTIKNVSLDLHDGVNDDTEPFTEYEGKFMREGAPVYMLEASFLPQGAALCESAVERGEGGCAD